MNEDEVISSWEKCGKKDALVKTCDTEKWLRGVGLEPTKSLTVGYVFILIDAAQSQLADKQSSVRLDKTELLDVSKISPSDFAVKLGRETISIQDYLINLREIGLDVDELMAVVDAQLERNLDRKTKTEYKARRLLELLLSSPFINQRDLDYLVDQFSIYEFASLLLAKKSKVAARLNALKKNQKTNEAREFTRKKWMAEKDDYHGNKSAFARDYVGIISNQFNDTKGDPLHVTQKTIRDVWLSDTPSASKQAG